MPVTWEHPGTPMSLSVERATKRDQMSEELEIYEAPTQPAAVVHPTIPRTEMQTALAEAGPDPDEWRTELSRGLT
jgi:hypothetical protein